MRNLLSIAGLASLFLMPSELLAGRFDELDAKVLRSLVEDPANAPRAALSLADVTGLPSLFRESRSALLVVKTDLGNYARVLVSVELRKPVAEGAEPFPVFALERFETFDPSRPASRLARGRDMILFDGFQVDLDTGQIVPPGQGGDLQYVSQGGSGTRLVPIGNSKLVAPTKVPASGPAVATQPTPGRVVVPSDFAGRFRLYSNGQWSGSLELSIDPKSVATGQFRSDLNGSTYAVTGQVAADSPGKIQFSITFPRSRQEFEGFLWSEGKGAMAGTSSLLERTFGFFAIREGGKVAADEDAESPDVVEARVVQVEATADGWKLDGKAIGSDALADAFKGIAAGSVVSIGWPQAIPADRLTVALAALKAQGIGRIVIQTRKDDRTAK